ncbi:MAG TPA: helix-turn-helix transcriptional regulator [Roseiarcus sp.]|nr:helix-turn-helix transcriptional regulator [Roseiarcus sp.]
MITGAQVKAARELLRWSRDRLADEAHIARSVVTICERGEEKQSELVVDAIQDALERAGVEFSGRDTVKVTPLPPPDQSPAPR